MSKVAYYENSIESFLSEDQNAIAGVLSAKHSFAIELQQMDAWRQQIKLLQQHLRTGLKGQIYFEFSIPRMGKRADVVLLVGGMVFVLEFKVGATSFDRFAIEQVHDYALDLKNFHRGSHTLPVIPILIATAAPTENPLVLSWASDQVATPICISANDLRTTVDAVLDVQKALPVDSLVWSESGYQPTPTIVEAALALYRKHEVRDITRTGAGAENLSRTSDRVDEIINQAKSNGRKVICFITGVPGAGKTLAGLNIATSHSQIHGGEHAVFLSGNGPLVAVLREALARDKATREDLNISLARRQVSTFIQNIHHFRDEALRTPNPPAEKVVVFDEAQRAWDTEQASKFMREKRGQATFDMSEPAFLLQTMNRHRDWCAVICLVGGGQEINTGEAGLAEWLTVLNDRYPDWDVYVSNRLQDSDYIWDENIVKELTLQEVSSENALHLGVSVRSFRAETLSEFVGHVVDNRPGDAAATYREIVDRYPIFLTRSLIEARSWLRGNARGSERYGLVASSRANRLRPDGIWVKSKVDAPVWFLNDKTDVRSSYRLEETATEFDIQGLELDWVCVGWDADFRRSDNQWKCFKFSGTEWQRVNKVDRRLHLKNAYRVLLTRARQGMVIFVPHGDRSDPTRAPDFYDQTYAYLRSCGLSVIG